MEHMRWTSKQYEEENTREDLRRLVEYLDKREKVEQQKIAEEKAKENQHQTIGTGTTGKYGRRGGGKVRR